MRQKLEQAMYQDAYNFARYLKESKQDLAFIEVIRKRGIEALGNSLGLGLSVFGLSMELSLRLTRLIIKYNLKVVNVILSILDGSAKGFKVSVTKKI